MSLEMPIQIIFTGERGQMPVAKAARGQADPRPPGKVSVSGNH
jgi:hypothetical protein